MGNEFLSRALLRDKRFWAILAAAIVVAISLIFWTVRSVRRSQARDALNQFPAFQSPALEIQFPRIVPDSAEIREVLAPGVRNGLWTLRERNGKPPSIELFLTNEGQQWFSVVGNQVVATFKAGKREATEVFELNDTFPSRQIRFRYSWAEFHPACVILGGDLPTVGQIYDGEAVLFYEKEHWRLMQWNTPDFDRAVARFKTLPSASR